ncbi:golgin subfamily A member 6-like protein 6 [Mercenaria mercenaria]|uniref:golgin subfamily A member 6-like protein 6 n=1 Tax=Mercenaria mercenaria TaxID=6596 RepID=UPI00234FAF4D|nr:golgin subfamily A member 6-like protein 6 [Mercenaria mercenaria]
MYHDTRSVYSDIHLPEKNNLNTPRPITDLGIRRALKKDDDLKRMMVTPQDEKILSLITKKGEWEKKYWKQRLKNSLAWDTEKEESDHLKLEKDKSHRMKVEIMREEDRQMVHMKRLQRQKKRLKKKTQLLSELEEASKATEKALKRQKKLQAKQIKEMAEKEKEHKENQEKNWWDLNSREYEKKMQEKIDHDKKRLKAEEKREEMIKEEKEKVAHENEEERMYFTERYVVYEKKAKESQKALTARIERRLTTTEKNHNKKLKERYKEIKDDAMKEEERLHHAMKEQKKLEKQQHKRMLKMFQKTQESIEKANTNLSKAFETITTHIKKEREEKEHEQRKHMKKLRKETTKWNKKISKEIQKEEEIMKEKQEDRARMMEQTRNIAHGSRVLRNKLRDTYGAENFDKKVFRVERFHSLGTRPSTQDWNTSSISLL